MPTTFPIGQWEGIPMIQIRIDKDAKVAMDQKISDLW
jgi:hypothetical protein